MNDILTNQNLPLIVVALTLLLGLGILIWQGISGLAKRRVYSTRWWPSWWPFLESRYRSKEKFVEGRDAFDWGIAYLTAAFAVLLLMFFLWLWPR